MNDQSSRIYYSEHYQKLTSQRQIACIAYIQPTAALNLWNSVNQSKIINKKKTITSITLRTDSFFCGGEAFIRLFWSLLEGNIKTIIRDDVSPNQIFISWFDWPEKHQQFPERFPNLIVSKTQQKNKSPTKNSRRQFPCFLKNIFIWFHFENKTKYKKKKSKLKYF